jgi:hypothetical protein
MEEVDAICDLVRLKRAPWWKYSENSVMKNISCSVYFLEMSKNAVKDR